MNEPRTYLKVLSASDHRSLESWRQVEDGTHPPLKANETEELPQSRVEAFRYANDVRWSRGIHTPLTTEQAEELAEELARGIADLADLARRLGVTVAPRGVEPLLGRCQVSE